MMKKPQPDDLSGDIKAMMPYWHKATTMLAGTDAMRAAGQRYLPRFPNETESDYAFRLKTAKFTNIFGDIVETLSAKPFAKEIKVDKVDGAIKGLIENVDAQGNHIHRFASNVFYSAIASGMDWILVDYTKTKGAAKTIADEKALGARPYWVHVPGPQVIAVYSANIQGIETLVHFRIKECSTERDGWTEREIERVRVFNREVMVDETGQMVAQPATWEVWEEKKDETTKKEVWLKIDEGQVTIGIIPLVPVITGRRDGLSWRVQPPLSSAADLQIEHYQQESGLKYAREMTCFPMLAGNGIEPPIDKSGKIQTIPIGPKTVLFAPPNGDGNHGEWSFVEPSSQSLTFLSGEIDKTEDQLRELGRQPLTAKAGNITTITAAYAGDKALTVIEAWALNLKDALEKALIITAKWLNISDAKPTVEINTDFAVDMMGDSGVTELSSARKNGDLSRETYWAELRRRNILGPNFDAEEEATKITDEQPEDVSPADLAAAMGGGQQPASGAPGRMTQ